MTPKSEEIGGDRVQFVRWHLCEQSARGGEEGAVIPKCITEMGKGRDARMGQVGRTTAGPDTFRTVVSSQESKKPCLQDSMKTTSKERSWDSSELRDEAGGSLETTIQQHNENSCLNMGVRNSMTKIESGCGTCQKSSPWGWREKEKNRESK